MRILSVSNGGFGDASWCTSWPRIFSENGHEIDVLLMEFTGNPYHANPYIGSMFVFDRKETASKIMGVINAHSYDIVLIPDNNNDGVQDVIEVTKKVKSVYPFRGCNVGQEISGLKIPPLTKPEWYFTPEEYQHIEKYKDCILIHPTSSSIAEESRNVEFGLVIECARRLDNVVVMYGGKRKYLPIPNLRKMESAGIRVLWEGYNCFNDKSGTALGKFLALSSVCRASVHAWSGSFTFSMGFNKPYVMVVPGHQIRANSGAPYIKTEVLYEQGIARARRYGCLNPSAWCITKSVRILTEALDHVQAGKTCTYDGCWEFLEG